jgi:hypothetical protein
MSLFYPNLYYLIIFRVTKTSFFLKIEKMIRFDSVAAGAVCTLLVIFEINKKRERHYFQDQEKQSNCCIIARQYCGVLIHGS